MPKRIWIMKKRERNVFEHLMRRLKWWSMKVTFLWNNTKKNIFVLFISPSKNNLLVYIQQKLSLIYSDWILCLFVICLLLWMVWLIYLFCSLLFSFNSFRFLFSVISIFYKKWNWITCMEVCCVYYCLCRLFQCKLVLVFCVCVENFRVCV